MTPSDAVTLLETHQDMWPEWVEMPTLPRHVGAPEGVLPIRVSGYGLIKVALGVGYPGAMLARVRPGLSDEENVRRILAAAQKSYDQRRRQLDKKRKPLNSGPPPERKTKLGPNRKRKAKAFAENFGGKDRVLWGKARPCDTCGAPPPSQNSHVLSRRSCLGKAREVISQCQACHDNIGAMDTAELLKIAAKVYAQWLAQGGHELESGLETHGETR